MCVWGERGFQLMLLCVQAVTAKDVQNLKSKKQLSGYNQCYIYKNQSLEVSKKLYMKPECLGLLHKLKMTNEIVVWCLQQCESENKNYN